MHLLAQATIDILKQAQQQGGIGITPASSISPNDPTGPFGAFLSTVLQMVMAIGLLAILVFLVWGAVEWIVAGGEKSKVEAARNKITGAIVGLFMLVATLAIFTLVQDWTGIHILNIIPGTTTQTQDAPPLPGQGPQRTQN